MAMMVFLTVELIQNLFWTLEELPCSGIGHYLLVQGEEFLYFCYPLEATFWVEGAVLWQAHCFEAAIAFFLHGLSFSIQAHILSRFCWRQPWQIGSFRLRWTSLNFHSRKPLVFWQFEQIILSFNVEVIDHGTQSGLEMDRLTYQGTAPWIYPNAVVKLIFRIGRWGCWYPTLPKLLHPRLSQAVLLGRLSNNLSGFRQQPASK